MRPATSSAKQVIDVLNTKLVRRNIDLKSVSWGKPEAASGGTVRIVGTLSWASSPILRARSTRTSRTRSSRCKVQIEGDKLRVSAPVRDVLQAVIAFLKEPGLRHSAAVHQLPVAEACKQPPSIAFITLGCPKNEVDTDRMRAAVAGSSYRLEGDSSARRRRRRQHLLVHPRGHRGVHSDDSRPRRRGLPSGSKPQARGRRLHACPLR